MRLLFDEQLSEELVTALRDLFPESLHVRLLGKSGAADPVVWQLAVEHGSVLVTKDEDVHRLSVLHGAPPKVVWLRLGNCATGDRMDQRIKAGLFSLHGVAADGGRRDDQPPQLKAR